MKTFEGFQMSPFKCLPLYLPLVAPEVLSTYICLVLLLSSHTAVSPLPNDNQLVLPIVLVVLAVVVVLLAVVVIVVVVGLWYYRRNPRKGGLSLTTLQTAQRMHLQYMGSWHASN